MGEFPKIQSFDLVGPENSSLVGSPIASATTIAPDHGIHHVTGVAAIETVTIPWAGFSGTIYLIADGLFTWVNTGNIASAGSVGSTGQVLQLTYDPTNAKWYPALLPISALSSTTSFNNITSGTNTTAAMVIGNGASLTSLGTGLVELQGQVNISGPDATTNVEIGSAVNDANAGVGGRSVVIGDGASNGTVAENVIIGAGCSFTTTGSGVLIGSDAAAGAGVSLVGIGRNITPRSLSVIIGDGASGTGNGCIVLGTNATGGATQFVAGSASTIINNVYFGRGVADGAAPLYTINGTGGSGTNNAGAGINIAGGKGTGTAAGGDVKLQRSPSIATGSTAQSLTDAFLIRSQKKDLVDATATAFVRVNIAQGVAGLTGWTGGTVFYTIIANDATNYQARAGSFNFAIVNEAGTEVCVIGTVSSEADCTPTGTLTVTFDSATGTDTVDLRATAASSLTETTLAMFYSVILNGPGTLTPQ